MAGAVALGRVATVLVFRLEVNSAWLVLGGALVGVAVKILG